LAVEGEGDGVHVGVDFDGDGAGGALGPGVAGDVEDRGVGPVRLVVVEGVFGGLAVVGDEAFVVAAGGVAFIAGVDGEVEHVPDGGFPGEGAGFEGGPIGFVENVLVFLGVEEAGLVGFGGDDFVLIDACPRAVFGDAEGAGGEGGVGVIEEGGEVVDGAGVPPEVFVEADDVGDPVHLGGGAQVGGGGGGACGVFLVGEGVEGGDDAAVGGVVGDFVEESPDDDGGVVVVLADHFLELLFGVVEEGLGGGEVGIAGAVHGDFAPGGDAILIEERVGEGGVLVV
jgi:hypothetical protein